MSIELVNIVLYFVRVAQHEDSNRMTSSALAIVFAPSLLRSNRNMPAQESLLQVGKQTRYAANRGSRGSHNATKWVEITKWGVWGEEKCVCVCGGGVRKWRGY